MSTIQLDFLAKERFGLTYTDENGNKNSEVFVIHRAPLSTHERFLAFLVEHYAGAFPLWLAPVQAVFASVGESHVAFVEELAKKLRAGGARVEVDVTGEKISAKVRKAAAQKIPWTIVVGDKEIAGGDFQVKVFGEEKPVVIPAREVEQRILKRPYGFQPF
jgi:threonyl-tRNA synthetase